MNEWMEVIKLVIQSATTIAVAYIAYKQVIAGRVLNDVKKQTNGLVAQTIAAEKAASKQEGITEGKGIAVDVIAVAKETAKELLVVAKDEAKQLKDKG